jgi:hypothetical protein
MCRTFTSKPTGPAERLLSHIHIGIHQWLCPEHESSESFSNKMQLRWSACQKQAPGAPPIGLQQQCTSRFWLSLHVAALLEMFGCSAHALVKCVAVTSLQSATYTCWECWGWLAQACCQHLPSVDNAATDLVLEPAARDAFQETW